MAWARLDDRFHEHRKVVEAGPEAVGLWVMCLTWANAERRNSPTPGVVPHSILVRFVGPAKAKRLGIRLFEVGLFDEMVGDSWPIHDFDQYLPKYDAEANRDRARRGGQASAAKRTAKQTGSEPPSKPLEQTAKQTSTTRASARRNPVPVASKEANTSAADATSNFDDFWDAYPRKTARRKAESAWRSALKRVDADTILAGLKSFPFGPDPQFHPYPATWLNQDRWADAPVLPLAVGNGHTAMTPQQIEDILGADSWQLPAPPPELDPEDDWASYQAWARQLSDEHFVQREAEARAELARRVTT